MAASAGGAVYRFGMCAAGFAVQPRLPIPEAEQREAEGDSMARR